MKEYLKMSDVFGGEVFYSGCKVVMSGGAQSQYSDAMLALDSKKSEYAAHAINSHDELVAEVERLTKECNQLTEQLFEADAMVQEMQQIIDGVA